MRRAGRNGGCRLGAEVIGMLVAVLLNAGMLPTTGGYAHAGGTATNNSGEGHNCGFGACSAR